MQQKSELEEKICQNLPKIHRMEGFFNFELLSAILFILSYCTFSTT